MIDELSPIICTDTYRYDDDDGVNSILDVNRGYVEAKKRRQKRILSGLFVENSKLTSLSFHFLLKTQTRVLIF